MEYFTVHLLDENDNDRFPIYVETILTPRVGDHVHYWVNYPEHMPTKYSWQEGEPAKIDGVVSKVEIEYRKMGYGGHPKVYTIVSVSLRDYKVTPAPALASIKGDKS